MSEPAAIVSGAACSRSTRGLALEASAQLVEARLQGIGLGRDLAAIGVGALQGIGSRGEAGLDRIEALAQLGGPGDPLGELPPGGGGGVGGLDAAAAGHLDLLFGFGERSTGGAGAAGADAPTGGAEAIALRALSGAFTAGVYPVGMKIAVGWTVANRALLVGALVGALTLGSASPHLIALAGGADWRWTIGLTSAIAVFPK